MLSFLKYWLMTTISVLMSLSIMQSMSPSVSYLVFPQLKWWRVGIGKAIENRGFRLDWLDPGSALHSHLCFSNEIESLLICFGLHRLPAMELKGALRSSNA
jgi:hypothetical protein